MRGKTITDVLNMSIEEGVKFFAAEPAIGRKIEILADLGLGYLTLGQSATTLSGGEAQRVSLARTMANAPEVLLLDEPTSALDEESARRIEDLVMDIIHERRMTCIIVTHNAAQAHRIADRTMILEHGRLVAIGPTEEVLHDR